jgi:hypothetical protein
MQQLRQPPPLQLKKLLSSKRCREKERERNVLYGAEIYYLREKIMRFGVALLLVVKN